MGNRREFLKGTTAGGIVVATDAIASPAWPADVLLRSALSPFGKGEAVIPRVQAKDGPAPALEQMPWDGASGVSRDYFNVGALLPWQNAGGDWLDANGVAQGPVPLAAVLLGTKHGSVDIDLSRFASLLWQGILLVGRSNSARIGMRQHANARRRPVLVCDGATVECRRSAAIDAATPVVAETATIAAGKNVCLLFNLPFVPQQATLRLYVTNTSPSGACALDVFLLRAPRLFAGGTPRDGLALANVVVRAWLDGVLVFERSNVVLTKHTAIKVDEVWLDHSHGNPGTAEADHPFAMAVLVAARAYVGPLNDLLPPPVVPDPPSAVTATAGVASATVSFTPPASDGGSPITGCTVTSNPAGGVDAQAGSLATSRTVIALSNGVSYTFTVTATNAIGTSAPSAPSNSVVPMAPATVPGAPTDVVATAGNAPHPPGSTCPTRGREPPHSPRGRTSATRWRTMACDVGPSCTVPTETTPLPRGRSRSGRRPENRRRHARGALGLPARVPMIARRRFLGAAAAAGAAAIGAVAGAPLAASAYSAVMTKLPTHWRSPSDDNEAEYANWTNFAYDAARDRFYLVPWHCVLESFDPVAIRWTEETPSFGHGVHNRTYAVDPYNDRMWIGTGTGSFTQPKAPSPTPLAFWDLASKRIVLAGEFGRWGSECACYLDPERRRFVIYGGWGRLGVQTMTLAPLEPAQRTGPPIPWRTPGASDVRSAQRMTHWRGGVDARRQRAIFVDVTGDVWALALSTLAWTKVFVGAGVDAPGQPHTMTQFVVDDELDALVGWSATAAIAGGSALTPIHALWLFRFAEPGWVSVPFRVHGDAKLPPWTYVGFQMAYDGRRRRTLLHGTAGNYNPSTWTIEVRAA